MSALSVENILIPAFLVLCTEIWLICLSKFIWFRIVTQKMNPTPTYRKQEEFYFENEKNQMRLESSREHASDLQIITPCSSHLLRGNSMFASIISKNN